jgi:hypothetical protein
MLDGLIAVCVFGGEKQIVQASAVRLQILLQTAFIDRTAIAEVNNLLIKPRNVLHSIQTFRLYPISTCQALNCVHI